MGAAHRFTPRLKCDGRALKGLLLTPDHEESSSRTGRISPAPGGPSIAFGSGTRERCRNWYHAKGECQVVGPAWLAESCLLQALVALEWDSAVSRYWEEEVRLPTRASPFACQLVLALNRTPD
jgi:hypothetical protein